jgi:hypothetical protein
MDINNIVSNVLQANRQNTEKILDSINALHTKNEELTEKAVKESGVIPEQGRQVILQWIQLSRESRQNLKKQALEGHDNLEKLLKVS